MYDFHYNFIKKNFNAELLFTDTESLTYEIKSENVYEELLSIKVCLILVSIQKIQSFLMRLIRKLLEKWKINLVELLKKNLLDESQKCILWKKYKTAKGVSITNEFNKFKNFYLAKNYWGTKWEEIKVKSIN